jgi:hypothetical protein
VFLNNKDDGEMVTIVKANTKPVSDPFGSATSGLVQVRGCPFQIAIEKQNFHPKFWISGKQATGFVCFDTCFFHDEPCWCYNAYCMPFTSYDHKGKHCIRGLVLEQNDNAKG